MKKDFLNFSVGPVQMYEEELEIGAKQPPYFRTDEFSKITLENERIMKKLAKTEDSSKVIFLTKYTNCKFSERNFPPWSFSACWHRCWYCFCSARFSR